MAEQDNDPLTAAPDPESGRSKKQTARSTELCRNDDILTALTTLYSEVEAGFGDQNERYDRNVDHWKLYDCELSDRQMYNGNSRIFVPLIHDAVNARKTRFTNQIFPSNNRYVEVTSSDIEKPYALTALLTDYVRRARLRTVVMPALVKNGDIEGHYSIYTGWMETTRSIAYKSDQPIEIDGEEFNDPDLNVETVEEEEIKIGRPYAEVVADGDVLILPATSDSVDEALDEGGSATVVRKWSKSLVAKKIADKSIDKENGEMLLASMSEIEGNEQQRERLSKKKLEAAGIQETGEGLMAIIYETWTMLKLPDGTRKLCRIYFAGSASGDVLSCRRNPYWNDKCPLLSVPVEKVSGAFKGKSKVAPVATLQIQANDAVNMGMDSAAYSMLPIVMTDPEKNPRIGSMVISMGAIWETSPQDTQFAEFPKLWQDGMEIAKACESQINVTLGVNSAMIPGQKPSNNLTQAEIAADQQVDLLTTADAVTVLEEGILTPMLQRWVEYDHQFRDQAVTVRQYGALGVKASMDQVEPIQFDAHYQFRWFGVEQAKSAQKVQQQIAALNVIRGIPPQMYQGYTLNAAPIIMALVEDTFGPNLAPEIFKDSRSELAQKPEIENEVLAGGMYMPIHMMDDHQQHIQVHMQLLQQMGDPTGFIRQHIMEHQHAMQQQVMAQQQAGQPMPGAAPPGGPPGQGQPPAQPMQDGPRMGAQPAPMRSQGPPGMIPQDSMQDASRMPRPQRM